LNGEIKVYPVMQLQI